MDATQDQTIEVLETTYSFELEMVMDYEANSGNLREVGAESIEKLLAADISQEIGRLRQPSEKTKNAVGSIQLVIPAGHVACTQFDEDHPGD